MSQPLPHGILPMETHRIIQNEKILPGITKVLLLAQDFPQLNYSPEAKLRIHDLTVLNQMTQVFVYEERADDVNATRNGTLNLIRTLPEGAIVTAADLNNIRK